MFTKALPLLFFALLLGPLGLSGSCAALARDYVANLDPTRSERWAAHRMPLKVYIEPADQVSGYDPRFDALLRDSFQTWTVAMGGHVSFAEVYQPENADWVITWIARPPKESKEAGGITRLFPGDDGPSKAEIRLVTFPQFRSRPNVRLTAIKFSCLHEIGHALGIAGHSPSPADVMHPNVRINQSSRAAYVGLTTADVNTLRRLYTDPAVLQRQQAVGLSSKPKHDIVSLGKQGNLCHAAKDYEGARRFYEQAYLIDRNDPRIKQNLALTYYALAKQCFRNNDLNQAEHLASRAIEMDPSGSHLGTAAESLLEKVRAVGAAPIVSASSTPEHSDESTAVLNSNFNNLIARAVEANNCKQWDKAIIFLEEANALVPGKPEVAAPLQVAYWNLGQEFYDHNDFSRAADLMKKAYVTRRILYGTHDPKAAELTAAYSYCLQQLGRNPAADPIYRLN